MIIRLNSFTKILNKMALKVTTPTSSIPAVWTGTNIYGQILLLVASLFGGMSTDTSGVVVAGGAGLVAALLAVRNWVINAHFNVDKSWIKDPNNIAYLTAVVVAISPKLGELIPGALDIFNALSSGNLGAIISAGVSLLSIVYYSFFKKK
jgi:hypothetical protein